MNKPTRFFSNKQEKQIAKELKGKQVANSGATAFRKGVNYENFRFICASFRQR